MHILATMEAQQEQRQHQITCKTGKEYLEKTTHLMTATFLGDPVYNWLLHSYSPAELKPILFKLLHGFLTACSLNRGLFIEVDSFGCCGVLMPPGTDPANPRTMIPAGIIPALFAIGFGGFKVRAQSKQQMRLCSFMISGDNIQSVLAWLTHHILSSACYFRLQQGYRGHSG
ncbi:hypothetical protein B0H63DRAFT_480896 [Podospora didyma]|uniref:Uncharacterized protein n=1 Tax=Podospora didyma TaxID=330526 RepID=A0AAE0KEQ8_9PEZI|nr:hypothetical protein B0H63DRAFT_480896 [Podospora didyma]